MRVPALLFYERLLTMSPEEINGVARRMGFFEARKGGAADVGRLKRMVGVMSVVCGRSRAGELGLYRGRLAHEGKTVTEQNARKLCDAMNMSYEEVGL